MQKSVFKEELFWFFAAPYTAAPETRTWDFFPVGNATVKDHTDFLFFREVWFKYILSISDSKQRTCYRSKKQYPKTVSRSSSS